MTESHKVTRPCGHPVSDRADGLEARPIDVVEGNLLDGGSVRQPPTGGVRTRRRRCCDLHGRAGLLARVGRVGRVAPGG
jgi:hypothetical protein